MGNERVNWIRGGMGCFKVLPVLAGLLTAVQMLPATNGTLLYHLIMTPQNIERADSQAKTAALYGAFLGANMMLQTFILYPFFHIYNYELCRRPWTPSGVPYVAFPHFMTCYSLLFTTAALDNMVNFGLKQST